MASSATTSTGGAGKKPSKQRKVFTLWVHDVNFSPVDLVINPEHFPPETKVGDIVEIYKQGHKEKALYLAVGAVTTIRANLHISVKDSVANACELANREEIVANVVEKDTVALDFAEVTFKDQFISRSDMWRLKMHLKDTCAYVGKSIHYSCIRASIRELLSSEQAVHSGYITANTKIVFRSRSAEYIMLFQMSKEMWDFAPDGQLYFEKAVNKFLPALFAKWRALGADHCLTMVMFSRTFYAHQDLFDSSYEAHNDDGSPEFLAQHCLMDSQQRENLLRDHQGRYYHDFYTVVCIEERTNWERVVLQLKTKFEEYPVMVNWKPPQTTAFSNASLKYQSNVLGINATSEHSGFLEAINLAQNMLDSRHFIDRDLTRTGQSVVVISAGTGIFIVNPSLEQQTKQRMIDKGIGCDLVCLTKPPSHVVPLFIMKKPYNSQGDRSPTNASGAQTPSNFLPPASAYNMPKKTFKLTFPSHKIAHWVYLFFYELHVQTDFGASNRTFTATSTMPDFLQQNTDCTGVIVPIKMAPSAPNNIAQNENTLANGNASADSPSSRHKSLEMQESSQGTSKHQQDTDRLHAEHGTSDFVPAPAARQLIGSTPDAASETLGILHHMEMDTNSTPSDEATQLEKMANMMDAYDASLFVPRPPTSKPSSTHSSSTSSRLSSQIGSGPNTSHPPTPSGALLSHHRRQHSGTYSNASTPNVNISSSGALGSRIAVHGTSTPRSTRMQTPVTPSPANLSTTGPLSSQTTGNLSVGTSTAATQGQSLSNTPTSSSTPSEQHLPTTVLRTPSKQYGANSTSISSPGTPHGDLHGSSTSMASSGPNTPRAPTVGMIELNPFTLELKPAPLASNRRRWEHLWTRHSIQFDFLESDPTGPHWKSLTQPASLPLTTSYFPTPKELKDNFQFYTHSVDPDDSVHPMTLEAHLNELIAQRLVQGAQMMQPDGGSTTTTNSAQLSAGNSFHQLTLKTPTIIVNWYVAKNKVWDHERIRYRYFLWTEHTSRRLSKEVHLHYKSIVHYPWNTLDQLLSGYQLEFMDNYNYWNINMMLVPSDAKMSASAAASGFTKFKDYLNQRMVKLSDSDFGPMKVDIHTDQHSDSTPSSLVSSPQSSSHSLNTNSASSFSAATGTSASAKDSNLASSSSASSASSATPQSQPNSIGQSAPSSGTTTKSGKTSTSGGTTNIPDLIDSHNLALIISSLKESNLVNAKYFRINSTMEQKSYMFVASKVVDWITSHVNVRNRTEAIDLCSGFVTSGIFKPISLPAGSPFRDGANYYAIADPTSMPPPLTTSNSNPTISTQSPTFVTASGVSGNMQHSSSSGSVSLTATSSTNSTTGGSLKAKSAQTISQDMLGAPAPPSSAPAERRYASAPGIATTNTATPSTSHAPIPTLSAESEQVILNSDAGILNTSHQLHHVSSHHHDTSSIQQGTILSGEATDTTSGRRSRGNSSSQMLFAPGSSGASGQLAVSIKPGSQPVESSPLDLESVDANVGSSAFTPILASNLPTSVMAHTIGDSMTRHVVGAATVEEEAPPPPMPHHTRAPSGTVRLQMDASKTDRFEWVNVSYDTIFDASVAYEFQFQWLCSTGCVLQEFVTQLTRKAKSFGFSLIQIPVRNDHNHSFLSPRKDSFAWSELTSAQQLAVCHVLVKVLDFLPRKRPNQFIHRSGVIMIDISNNIFQWSVNWTDVTAYTTAQNYQLLKRFRDFMAQVNQLKLHSSDPQHTELSYSAFLNALLMCVAPYSALSAQIIRDRATPHSSALSPPVSHDPQEQAI